MLAKILYRKTPLINSKIEELFDYDSGIEDFAAKIDFDYFPLKSHSIKFGMENIFHTFSPGVNHIKFVDDEHTEESADTTYGNNNISANELRLYAEDIIELSSKFKVNIGGHFSHFQCSGESIPIV